MTPNWYVAQPCGDDSTAVTCGSTAPAPQSRQSAPLAGSQAVWLAPVLLTTQPCVTVGLAVSRPYSNGTLPMCHGRPTPAVDWPSRPVVAVPAEPLGTVSWATSAQAAGPSAGCSQKMAASVDTSGVTSSQLVKSRPIELSSLAVSPSEIPTVSHESTCEPSPPGRSQIVGLVPPRLAPHAPLVWYAAGTDSGDVSEPKIAYTLVAPSDRLTLRRYVVRSTPSGPAPEATCVTDGVTAPTPYDVLSLVSFVPVCVASTTIAGPLPGAGAGGAVSHASSAAQAASAPHAARSMLGALTMPVHAGSARQAVPSPMHGPESVPWLVNWHSAMAEQVGLSVQATTSIAPAASSALQPASAKHAAICGEHGSVESDAILATTHCRIARYATEPVGGGTAAPIAEVTSS